MKKPWTAPGSSCWGKPWGHMQARSSIQRREGEMGARRLSQHPAGSCQTGWLQQRERICRVTNTWMWQRRRPPRSTSLQFLPPSCCSLCPTGCFCKHSPGDFFFFFFPLRVAGRQRSRNPPARCRAAKNPALRSELSTLLKTPETFSITTFQLQKRSCLKRNREACQNDEERGKDGSTEKSRRLKSYSIQSSAPRKVNCQCLATVCCVPLRKHADPGSSAPLPGNKTQKGPFLTTTSKCLSSFHHVCFCFEYSNTQTINSWVPPLKYSSHKLKSKWECFASWDM